MNSVRVFLTRAWPIFCAANWNNFSHQTYFSDTHAKTICWDATRFSFSSYVLWWQTTVTPVRGELDWIFQAEGIQRMQPTVTRRAVAGREVKAGCTQKWVKWAPSHLLHDAVNMTVYFLTIFLVTDVDAGDGKKKHPSLVHRLCDS